MYCHDWKGTSSDRSKNKSSKYIHKKNLFQAQIWSLRVFHLEVDVSCLVRKYPLTLVLKTLRLYLVGNTDLDGKVSILDQFCFYYVFASVSVQFMQRHTITTHSSLAATINWQIKFNYTVWLQFWVRDGCATPPRNGHGSPAPTTAPRFTPDIRFEKTSTATFLCSHLAWENTTHDAGCASKIAFCKLENKSAFAMCIGSIAHGHVGVSNTKLLIKW